MTCTGRMGAMWYWCKVLMVTTACWSLVVPVQALDRTGTSGAIHDVQDVSITPQRTLTGIRLNSAGQPMPGIPVALTKQGRVLAVTKTGTDGKFVFRDVSAGTYTVVSEDRVVLVRAWAGGTEPPHALAFVLLDESDVVRGQRPFADVVTNPLVIASVIAAAIAIPLAVHQSGKNRSGS